MIFLFLFATPFVGFGLLALVAGIRKAWLGDTKNGVSLSLFGLVFSLAGFGLMAAAFWGRKKARQTAELQARFAGKPWMMRPDWAEGKIKSSTMAQPMLLLVMGLAFCGIGGFSTFFALPEVWQKHNYAALLVLLFPLAGLGMLAAFFAAWRSQKRFGDCFFELAQIPIPLGGVLDGVIQTGKPLKLEHELNVKFSCVRQVTTGSGRDRSTQDYILWREEKIYSEQAALPQTGTSTAIPVHFKLPADQPECYSHGNESVFWRLEAKSKMRGPDFHAIFDVPVYKIAGTAIAQASDTGIDESDPTATLLAPIDEIRRDENSKIKISDGPNGREFYFPPARNIGTALFSTLGMILFSGAAIGLWRFHAPIFFPIIFGLVGILLILGTFSLWFKSVRITINFTNVRLTKRWLIFSRTRDFSASDYARFETKMGMQSGSTIFTNIKLVRAGADAEFARHMKTFQGSQQINQLVVERFRQAAGPAGVTVAGSIASGAEAEWLVKEMNRALGSGQPRHAYSPAEINDSPTVASESSKAKAILVVVVLIFAAVGGLGYEAWRHVHPVSARPAPLPNSVEAKTAATKPGLAFSSSGSYDDYETNGWPVKADGHASWFVSEASGNLRRIELKIEPVKQPEGKLFISIFQDRGGFLGRRLETLSVARFVRTNSAGWLVLDSRKQPALEAGAKYWISAKSPETWFWHFSSQDRMQEFMHLSERRKWVGAGDAKVCAFNVLVETNQAPGQK